MAHHIIIRKRSGSILFVETACLSLIGSVVPVQRLEVNWAWGVVAFLVLPATILTLFFQVKLFRYLFSVLFSLLWGLLVFIINVALDHDSGETAGIILGSVAFVISLIVHWREFLFYRDATVVEVKEE